MSFLFVCFEIRNSDQIGYSESDAVKLNEVLQNYYIQAKILIMMLEGYKALKSCYLLSIYVTINGFVFVKN